MKRYETYMWLAVLTGLLLLTSCSITGSIPRPQLPQPVGGDSALAITVSRLAFISGLAAIGAVAAGIALKQYATALVGGPALAGLALVFLLLPALAAAVKWLLICSVVMAIGGAAWLAWTRWKTSVALALTAKHADRMESTALSANPEKPEEIDDAIRQAKNMAHAEQVQAGVAGIIGKIRSKLSPTD